MEAAFERQHDNGASRENGSGPAHIRGSMLFRAVNERIRELEGDRVIGDYDFVCECEDDTCTSVVRMTAAQYEAVRAGANQYAVLPGHERAEAGATVSRAAGYVVVVKRAAVDTAAAGTAAGIGFAES